MEVEHLSKPYHFKKGDDMLKQIFKWFDRFHSEKTTKIEDPVKVRIVQIKFGWWAFVEFSFPCSISECRGIVFGSEVLASREVLETIDGIVFQDPVLDWTKCRGGEIRHFSWSPEEISAVIGEEVRSAGGAQGLNVLYGSF